MQQYSSFQGLKAITLYQRSCFIAKKFRLDGQPKTDILAKNGQTFSQTICYSVVKRVLEAAFVKAHNK